MKDGHGVGGTGGGVGLATGSGARRVDACACGPARGGEAAAAGVCERSGEGVTRRLNPRAASLRWTHKRWEEAVLRRGPLGTSSVPGHWDMRT